MLMIRWEKLITPYAILFVLSIPGSAFPPLREVDAAMRRMKNEETRLSKLGEEDPHIFGDDLTSPEILPATPQIKSLESPGEEGLRLREPLNRLRIIQKAADEVIENAAMVADYHADAALQIRTRYPREEAPMNVESHIQASDAARQEVRQLQGTVTEATSEKTAKAKASRAYSKATEAKDEYFKAEKAATDDAH